MIVGLEPKPHPPKASIVVPTFNASKTILRRLDSIRQQSLPDYAIIIQDGESIDGTIDLVRIFAGANRDMTIKGFQEADRGLYDAMNKAMPRCQGEWLLLGADDTLHDNDVLKLRCHTHKQRPAIYSMAMH